MSGHEIFSFTKLARSFRPAVRGLAYFIQSENNAKFHIFATLIAIGAGTLLRLNILEWSIILTQIGLVWAAEVFNTAAERIVDIISPDRNERAGTIKDLAAAAVLVTSLTAFVTGALVFGSKIFR